MCGVNDRLSLCRLSGRIRLAASGHLERRGHIAHIKGGRESRSPRLTAGQWGKSGGLAREGQAWTETLEDESEGKQEMIAMAE